MSLSMEVLRLLIKVVLQGRVGVIDLIVDDIEECSALSKLWSNYYKNIEEPLEAMDLDRE